MAQLTEATSCFCAEYVGNHLYLAAKNEKDFVTYRYDTVNNAWEILPSIPGSEQKIDCLCSINDYIYAIREAKPPHRFSLNTNQWQCVNSVYIDNVCPNTFCSKESVVFRSRLYVLHGKRRQVFYGRSRSTSSSWEGKSATMCCFDPETNEWKDKAPTSCAHFRSSLFVVNGRLYVAGGLCSINSVTGTPDGSAASVEVYDEQNNKWSVVRQKHIPPNNLGAVEIEGRVYFIINNFPIDSGIRIPPGEVYAVPLDE